MAWFKSKKKGSGGSIPTLSIHSGKINLNTGNIEEDSNYYYTDLFDAPNGYLRFDFGETVESYYVGLEMCASDGSRVNWWSANARYRQVNHAPYYASAPKLRATFKAANLQKVFIYDETNNIMFVACDNLHKIQ